LCIDVHIVPLNNESGGTMLLWQWTQSNLSKALSLNVYTGNAKALPDVTASEWHA
jgi:hypothetical protein